MFSTSCWLDTLVKQQKQEHYMNLQIDLLDYMLTTSPIQMGWETSLAPYQNCQFGYINYPKQKLGNSRVPTRTWNRSDSPNPLLTLPPAILTAHNTYHPLQSPSIWPPLPWFIYIASSLISVLSVVTLLLYALCWNQSHNSARTTSQIGLSVGHKKWQSLQLGWIPPKWSQYHTSDQSSHLWHCWFSLIWLLHCNQTL